jgi:hypothetical protein
MNKKNGSYPVVHIGTSFLLVIFIILCLVTFAVLSLSSALRDANYSRKESERTTAFYEANGTAEEKLGEVIAAFRSHQLETVDGISIADSSSDTSAEVSYEISINDTQLLDVTVLLDENGGLSDGIYQITCWKEITSSDWNGSSTLPVMGSDE